MYAKLTKGLIENHLVAHFGDRDLRSLREVDLLEFIRVKLDQGLAPKTIRNSLSVLRRVINLAAAGEPHRAQPRGAMR